MKTLLGLFAVAALSVMLYAPAANAQFGSLPNQAAWNTYLANHPKTAAELQANPSLIYNANWRRQHPHFEEWANNHPNDWRLMRQPAPWQNRYGAWDNDEWHDQDWWYHHRPDWAHEHHPDWWQEHHDWQGYNAGYRAGEEHEEQEEREEAVEHEHHHEPHGQAHGYYEHGPGSEGGPGEGHGHGHGHGHDKN